MIMSTSCSTLQFRCMTFIILHCTSTFIFNWLSWTRIMTWGLFLKSPETFRVPQFPLYLHNAGVLSHQTSQSSWFFLHQKHVKRSAFQKKWTAVWRLAFQAQKVLGTLKKQTSAPSWSVKSPGRALHGHHRSQGSNPVQVWIFFRSSLPVT